MPMADLLADAQRNLKHLTSLGALPSSNDVATHLRESVWPFLALLVEELKEHEECLDELTEGTSDILHEGTSDILRSAIAGGMGLLRLLLPHVPPDVVRQFGDQLAAFEAAAAQAITVIEEITVPDGDVDDDTEGDDDGEGEDQ